VTKFGDPSRPLPELAIYSLAPFKRNNIVKEGKGAALAVTWVAGRTQRGGKHQNSRISNLLIIHSRFQSRKLGLEGIEKPIGKLRRKQCL
jgi:hypothetical protein